MITRGGIKRFFLVTVYFGEIHKKEECAILDRRIGTAVEIWKYYKSRDFTFDQFKDCIKDTYGQFKKSTRHMDGLYYELVRVK